jgi:hypothetical protein
MLGVSLDRMADSVSGQTTVDPTGYLTSLANKKARFCVARQHHLGTMSNHAKRKIAPSMCLAASTMYCDVCYSAIDI